MIGDPAARDGINPSAPRAEHPAHDRSADALARIPINLWPDRLATGADRSWRLEMEPIARRGRLLRGTAMMMLCLVLTSGCYSLRKPPTVDEPVRVQVMSNESRLIHAQGYLQQAVADALVQKLGWNVSPAGTARLELSIAREDIGPVAKDARDITARWSIRLSGRALLASRKGNLTTTYSGVGYATGLADETEALRAAADQAAFHITAWLETAVKTLR
ncbi:MAG: hypothetical protein H0V44_12735 [Planctomycetes bacterium]|nr:hypothetical protein [Planctomycetota bacterium]